MVTLPELLFLSMALFCIGVFGVLVRKNILVILMSIELMLNAANIALVSFSYFNLNLDGQVVALLVFVVAAAEVAVGLGIVVAAYRSIETLDIDKWSTLRG